jgi:hypothetical protein
LTLSLPLPALSVLDSSLPVMLSLCGDPLAFSKSTAESPAVDPPAMLTTTAAV